MKGYVYHTSRYYRNAEQRKKDAAAVQAIMDAEALKFVGKLQGLTDVDEATRIVNQAINAGFDAVVAAGYNPADFDIQRFPTAEAAK